MQRFIRFLSAVPLALALLFSPLSVHADDCDDGSCDLKGDFCEAGCAYEDCRRAPNISPCYALSFVVAVGVIALLVTNGNSHASHSHSHS